MIPRITSNFFPFPCPKCRNGKLHPVSVIKTTREQKGEFPSEWDNLVTSCDNPECDLKFVTTSVQKSFPSGSDHDHSNDNERDSDLHSE